MSTGITQDLQKDSRAIHRRLAIGRYSRILLGSALIAGSGLSYSTPVDLHGPTGSGAFGTSVTALPNGNFLVTDPRYSTASTTNVGAVYFYGADGTLISTLAGSSANDQVGDGGIRVLPNGNFVILSAQWRNPDAANGVSAVGAVTWGSATDGVSGFVSPANSLVGERNAETGFFEVTPLANGNYVVTSDAWSDGTSGGAVTWANGATGTTGEIATTNSLTAPMQAGYTDLVVTALPNGNYVVASEVWNNGPATRAGAVTWCDGATGRVGSVSAANSLVGTTTDDLIGVTVTVLGNANYVVMGRWHGAMAISVGSATWGDGSAGIAGTVSMANSLYGDNATAMRVTALTNGNYVVTSPYWNGSTGAATWGNGLGGTAGEISSENSLVGRGSPDQVGTAVAALANGNYVVGSPAWTGDQDARGAGAATWGDGLHGSVGEVSVANSLIGEAGDGVGYNVTPLTNGNYVVRSPFWANGPARFAGATTWGDGASGTTGVVSSSNSLVGTNEYDEVGYPVGALANGNYVVGSPGWNSATASSVGAATWASGASGIAGPVSPDNSLVGDADGDFFGTPIPLSNGHSLIASSAWHGYTGIVMWVSGTTTLSGIASASHALTGAAPQDEIGYGGISTYSNGNYVVASPFWSSGGVPGAGAFTLVHGGGPVVGTVNANNSVVGNVMGKGSTLVFDYNPDRDLLVVGRPAENLVTVLDDDPVFHNGFD